MRPAILMFNVIVLIPTMFQGAAMAVEEARYRVLEKRGEVELRAYEPLIVAETVVEGDFSSVGNEAFQRLYGYISGKNRMARSISVTTPVSQEAESKRIPMTAPVTQERAGERWRIAFVMPAKLTLETLPEPTDPTVVLREIPGRTVAALTYSGTWSRKRYEAKLDLLLRRLREAGLKPVGEPVFARYNPPFTPWFLRRNEILIPVERA